MIEFVVGCAFMLVLFGAFLFLLSKFSSTILKQKLDIAHELNRISIKQEANEFKSKYEELRGDVNALTLAFQQKQLMEGRKMPEMEVVGDDHAFGG